MLNSLYCRDMFAGTAAAANPRPVSLSRPLPPLLHLPWLPRLRCHRRRPRSFAHSPHPSAIPIAAVVDKPGSIASEMGSSSALKDGKNKIKKQDSLSVDQSIG